MDHRDFGWSNFWIWRKVEAATFQGQLYLWATISRFSHTNEYVVKENNLPLSRRGTAPSAWVLRLSIGPSTPPSLEDLDTKCPYEFHPTVSNHRPQDGIGTPTRKSWEFGPKHLLWKKNASKSLWSMSHFCDTWLSSIQSCGPGTDMTRYYKFPLPVKVPKNEESK